MSNRILCQSQDETRGRVGDHQCLPNYREQELDVIFTSALVMWRTFFFSELFRTLDAVLRLTLGLSVQVVVQVDFNFSG